jgi:glutamate-1-semialdehyde 2,1-aminomutase
MSRRTYSRSESLRHRAESLTPGGVHSNVRLSGPKRFFARGEGAWLWDVDGNDYVDHLLGQGPNFLGHAPRRVNDAVAHAVADGSVFGAQHELEIAAGERFLTTVGWAERVRFGLSGTEMVQAALRLARAVTGRQQFVRFEGHYHGWLDNVLLGSDECHRPVPASQGQLASHLDDAITLPWNDLDVLHRTLEEHGPTVAAVIMEPFMCNSGAIEPRDGYLGAVRELCDRHGVVLIFDEVITGFRLAPGGAAERYRVIPDLATYGKAMAGGWPVAALAGKAALMDRFADGVTHAGTFNASMMACAAVDATLRVLQDDSPHDRVEKHGEQLMGGIRDLGRDHDLPLQVQGLGMAFHVSFGEGVLVRDARGLEQLDLSRYQRLATELVEGGIWVTGRGIWYVSAAHGDRELTEVLERFDAVLTDAHL